MNRANNASFSPAKTRDWIFSELAEKRIVGCSINVLHKGLPVLCESFGQQNSKGALVTPSTRFWIASMTKPIVSIAALHLIERGVLSLGDPVSKFIVGFGEAGVLSPDGNVVPVHRPPTVKDLLTHASGVTYGQFGSDSIHQRYGQARVFEYTSNNAEMAARLTQLPLLHQPGTAFEYGMSTDLLGRILEIVTGDSLDTVLGDIVLKPLGMANTSFSPDPDTLSEIAPSPVQEAFAPDFTTSPTWFSGGAGLFSTGSDYMLFARMLLGRGKFKDIKIIERETFARMCQPSLAADVTYGQYTESLGISAPWAKNGLSFGLGVAVRTTELEGIPGGLGECSWPGVSGANFWVDPKNDLIVVFLTHAPLHRTTHRVQLRNAIYSGIDSSAAFNTAN